jgi:hypothetical protein
MDTSLPIFTMKIFTRRPKEYNYEMKVRLLAFGLAAWVAAYVWVYVRSMRDQGTPPYWWYLAIVWAGVVPSLLAAAGWPFRPGLICGAVFLGIAAVLALPSIGMLLLPGVIAAAAAAVLGPHRRKALPKARGLKPEGRALTPANAPSSKVGIGAGAPFFTKT